VELNMQLCMPNSVDAQDLLTQRMMPTNPKEPH
jgi:hypothetical protein